MNSRTVPVVRDTPMFEVLRPFPEHDILRNDVLVPNRERSDILHLTKRNGNPIRSRRIRVPDPEAWLRLHADDIRFLGFADAAARTERTGLFAYFPTIHGGVH